MEHVVFFPSSDGSPAFRRVAALDEAVRLVEHLRNVEGVTEVGVHRLTDVPLVLRAYYRVEVPPVPVAPEVAVEAPQPAEPLSAAPELASAAVPPQAAAPVDEPAREASIGFFV